MREKNEPDGWIIREILDPFSGKRINQYFYKRNRAPRIEITSKLAQQLAGYTLIEKDLRSVGVWLKEIDRLYPRPENSPAVMHVSGDRETFNIIKGLYVAALTFYGKCFTQCAGRRVRLERNILDEEYREIHDDVMHMRHNYAAHSGADSFEDVKIALVLHPKKHSDIKPKLYRELSQADFKDSSEDEIRFLQLAEHLRTKVLSKISIVDNRIFEKEISPKGKEYWYARAKRTLKVVRNGR